MFRPRHTGTVETIDDVPGPALATLIHRPFSDQGWVFERKLDGVRSLATRHDGRVRLRSRRGGDQGNAFPEIVDALSAQRTPDFVVDGEIVAFDDGQTSFARLQPRIHLTDAARARRTGVPVFYYVFDVLHLAGESTRGLPMRDRKSLLGELFDYADPLRFCEHRVGSGTDLLARACADGWEGLIAKRAAAPYPSGRSRDWLKLKCERGQEFVVGGWTDPSGSRYGFGALLLGYYDGSGRLVYAGKVGTGFDGTMLADLRDRLDDLGIDAMPFEAGMLPRPVTKDGVRIGIHWVRPELVAEVRFGEWTRDGQLRHPRFLGLRTDKPARAVVRED